ncbi:MAG: HNH endonuclease [Clostridium sp.]|uniref:HNH endonuclease n=1 Tax=Clostridium culturomicium TaxID=1499683 RepID=UPI00058BC4FE|nr:HNH endonuclease [Clostridium culturomicium]MDU4890988.1 HNH endonuclease [Clostridium sp.]MDU7085629.1 HNH endonuclease [Clostridium sp.]
MRTKVCKMCGKELSIESFNIRKGYKDGYNTKCKKCEVRYNQEYYKKHKAELDEKHKKYRENNKEYLSNLRKQYYKSNKEKELVQAKMWRNKNKDKIRNSSKRWYECNKGKVLVKNQRRRTKLSELPATITNEQWIQIKNDFKNKCAYCGRKLPLHMEHFIPLSKGGEMTVNNIIPSCKSCNCSKGTKLFHEWYKEYEHYDVTREKHIYKYLRYVNSGIQQLKII